LTPPAVAVIVARSRLRGAVKSPLLLMVARLVVSEGWCFVSALPN